MNQNLQNLNRLSFIHGLETEITGVNGSVAVYFRDLERHLIQHIKGADVVVGCVAWLTHFSIVQALSGVPKGVSLIIQKEDFLRPDLDSRENWASELRKRYATLRSLEFWPDSLAIVTDAINGDRFIDPVRCVGIYNRANLSAAPRMHHKFLVFCKLHQTIIEDRSEKIVHRAIEPYSVWTGSFNFTKNAVNSLENAVVITNSTIAQAYYQEWLGIAWSSESLDWTHDWIQPEWGVT